MAYDNVIATTTAARMRRHTACLLKLSGWAKLSMSMRLQIGGICHPRVWHGGGRRWWWLTVDGGGG
jgi:hypothetical protein